MKIGLISEFFYPDNLGGSGTILADLCRSLQDQFEDVQIEAVTSRNLYRGEAQPLAARENWNGIEIFRVKTPATKRNSSRLRILAGLYFTFAVFCKLALRPRYDVLIVSTSPPMLPLAAIALKMLRGTPYVYLIHDLYAEMSVALGLKSPASRSIRISKKMQKSFFGRASKVVALGRCMKDHLISEFHLPPDKVEVATNWGTIESVTDQAQSRFRQQNELHGTVVMYAGNFGQFHNFDNLLDAAKMLMETHPSITFVLVGDGAKKSHIKNRISQDKLANVRLLPYVPREELADMLAATDISLITLEKGVEGLAVPSKLYNVLASGRAVVAIMGPTAETALAITEADCGIRVDQEDAEQLANVLASLADDCQRTRQMGRNAQAVYLKQYTLERVAEQYYVLLMGVSQRKNRAV